MRGPLCTSRVLVPAIILRLLEDAKSRETFLSVTCGRSSLSEWLCWREPDEMHHWNLDVARLACCCSCSPEPLGGCRPHVHPALTCHLPKCTTSRHRTRSDACIVVYIAVDFRSGSAHRSEHASHRKPDCLRCASQCTNRLLWFHLTR